MKHSRNNRHHIIPRSRCKGEVEDNIVIVDSRLHDLYHQLFSNKTPEEIAEFLNAYFWGYHYNITMTRL